jgi:hypothetical protein
MVKQLEKIDRSVGIDVKDRRIPITTTDNFVLTVDMDMPVQKIAWFEHPEEAEEDLEAGMGQVRPIVNSIGGRMGDEDIERAAISLPVP